MTQTETRDTEGRVQVPRRRRRRLHGFRGFLLVFGALVAVLVLLVGGFALYLNSMLSGNVQHADLLPHDGSVAVPRDPQAKDAQNILLLGSDTRSDDLGAGSRSDVIQLVHINSNQSRVSVVHFPRDLYVPIPGHGKNKINAAYAWGGAPLLVGTLQQLLEVHIDHVAVVSFNGFKDITDSLGGVDVRVAQYSDEGGATFEPGIQHMNGDEALAFVRERHQLARGDIDRGLRQQAWMQGILKKLAGDHLERNPVKLARTIDSITSNLVVDKSMTTGYLRSMVISLRDVSPSKIEFHTAPYTGFSTIEGVGSVDLIDASGMEALGKALRTDSMASLPGGTTTPG